MTLLRLTTFHVVLPGALLYLLSPAVFYTLLALGVLAILAVLTALFFISYSVAQAEMRQNNRNAYA